MHNGFVRVDNEKMSKSLGNFFTVRDVLAKYDPEVIRWFIARAHYRSPVNYSDQHLDDARAALIRLYTTLRDTPPTTVEIDWSNPYAARFREASCMPCGRSRCDSSRCVVTSAHGHCPASNSPSSVRHVNNPRYGFRAAVGSVSISSCRIAARTSPR